MGLEIMNFLMSMFILLGVLLHNTSTVNICIYVHNIIIVIINTLVLPDPTIKYREGVRGQAHQ